MTDETFELTKEDKAYLAEQDNKWEETLKNSNQKELAPNKVLLLRIKMSLISLCDLRAFFVVKTYIISD